MAKKKKKKKPEPPVEKQVKTAYVDLETAELLARPVGNCHHPMNILVLLGEDTENPVLVCQGCMTQFPVNFIEAGDEEE